MAIQISAELLEGVVLASLFDQDLYGYALTQQVQSHFEISESTIYPVLRRLKKSAELNTYDRPYQGRNRRYYQLTDTGRKHLNNIISDWHYFSAQVNSVLEETKDA